MVKTFKIKPIPPAKRLDLTDFMDSDLILKSTVLAAFETWSKAANLIFVEAAHDDRKPDITFVVEPDTTQMDSPNIDVFAYKKSLPDGRMTISIDGNQNWISPGFVQAAPVGIDLLTVLTHEIGHALGLDHEEVIETSIMFKNYVGIRHRLAPRDIAAITDIFGPVKSGFSFKSPVGGKVATGKKAQFIAIGTDQYLFYIAESEKGSAINRLKALRSRNLRVWERMELPEFEAEDFSSHLHIVKMSRRLLITRQGATRSNSRMAIAPISWYSPIFSKDSFDERTNIGLRDAQTIVFDDELLVVGIGENGLETYYIAKSDRAKQSKKYADEFDFENKKPWATLPNDGEQFKLVATTDRALLFKLEKNGVLNWHFNETGTAWSAAIVLESLVDIAVFDAISFGNLIYLAYINNSAPEVATVHEMHLDDSDSAKLKMGDWYQIYRFDPNEMAERPWKSLAIVQQNARTTLVADNGDRLFFQEI